MNTVATRPVSADKQIELTEARAAHNYHPLPVVLSEGHGAIVTDTSGREYVDCLAGYSALNFGHGHPALLAAAQRQLDRLTLTSRAFYNDRLGPFAAALGDLVGKEVVLPMNTGAEAVETALKVARRWGHQVKGVPATEGTIVVMDGNFHGRTTTIVSFSTDEEARSGFGPFTPGFRIVPYDDLAALGTAIDEQTVAVLLEPIQGEGGVVIPSDGFLRGVRKLCDDNDMLMIADEIQSGLARTGRTLAVDHEDVVPDIVVLGKALGGGILPVSAIAADHAVMDVITPGSHGSTFGGNPLACAVGEAVVELLRSGAPQARAAALGRVLRDGLLQLPGGVEAVRVRGLWAGVDIDPGLMTGREISLRLMDRGVLVKDTHGSTIRIAPPLVIEEAELRRVVEQIGAVLSEAGAA